MKVLAAMSGGVDSAMAAALAVEAGHDVTGVHMALLRNRALFREGSRGCCSIEDALDARRVADKMGIPFYVWDLSEEFADLVVQDFLTEYAAGRTPNPCIRCNEHVKFAVLANRAQTLGFDAVATGHYARIIARHDDSARIIRPSVEPVETTDRQHSPRIIAPGGFETAALWRLNHPDTSNDPDGGWLSAVELHRARNLAKDQSYVLAVAGPERLAHAYFPLGEFATKDEVRAGAAARNLPVSSKPDSYDICFIADGDTRGFLRERLGIQPGLIVDIDGNSVGEHDGAYQFTVGQRKGLALGNPAKDGEPRYVVRTDPITNTVIVGKKADLIVTSITATDPVWYISPDSDNRIVGLEDNRAKDGSIAPAQAVNPTEPANNPAEGVAENRRGGLAAVAGWSQGETSPPNRPIPVNIQVRAHGREVPAWLISNADGTVRFDLRGDVLKGIAAGQSVVAYQGTRVVAQATVSLASSERQRDGCSSRAA